MKKCILIFCLFLAAISVFGEKIVVISVTKSGSTWHNFFNCYRTVTTTLDHIEGDLAYVSVECIGGGFNRCRASNLIGTQYGSVAHTDVLANVQIVGAINSLINISEIAAESGTCTGASSKKVAIVSGNQTQLYFVKAQWTYNSKNIAEGQMTITIETDDSNLMNVRLRQ